MKKVFLFVTLFSVFFSGCALQKTDVPDTKNTPGEKPDIEQAVFEYYTINFDYEKQYLQYDENGRDISPGYGYGKEITFVPKGEETLDNKEMLVFEGTYTEDMNEVYDLGEKFEYTCIKSAI